MENNDLPTNVPPTTEALVSQTKPQNPSQSITQPVNASPKSNKSLWVMVVLLVTLLLAVVGAGAYYMGTQKTDTYQPTSSLVPTPVSTTVSSPSPVVVSPSVTTDANSYTNQEYGLSFSLKPGERVIECPNKNELNDNIGLWITKAPLLADPTIECATEGPADAVFMSKKPAQTVASNITSLESKDNGYKLTQTSLMIGSLKATRVTGPRDTTIPAPLPDSIDLILVEQNGMYYQLPYSYLARNLQIK